MEVDLRAGARAPARYRPRRPSQSVRYRCVQQHFETWLAQCRDGHDDDRPVPEHVEREFRRHLDCGILARGPGWLVPAPASLPARGHPGVGARAEVPRPACAEVPAHPPQIDA